MPPGHEILYFSVEVAFEKWYHIFCNQLWMTCTHSTSLAGCCDKASILEGKARLLERDRPRRSPRGGSWTYDWSDLSSHLGGPCWSGWLATESGDVCRDDCSELQPMGVGFFSRMEHLDARPASRRQSPR